MLTALFVVSALAQVETDTSQNRKYAAALETQISCWQKPEPTKAIRALQQASIISKRTYNVVDSVSFFKVK
jgi:hypothetical protein